MAEHQKCLYCNASETVKNNQVFDIYFACGTSRLFKKDHYVRGIECRLRQQARNELSKEIAGKLERVKMEVVDAFGAKTGIIIPPLDLEKIIKELQND